MIPFRDDAATFDVRRTYFTIEKLGPKQSLTPEGFLLCEEVPIARTGNMLYGAEEVPQITPGPNGTITVYREEKEVFRPEYIASFNGKPVVNDHPPEEVNPANWKRYAVGVVLSPRRGTGILTDLLIADLLITEGAAIADVRSGKIEVSCGYDADYEEDAPGRGRQVNMVGNHLALVEAGRCGPRCAIGDRSFRKGDDMNFRDELRKRGSARVSLVDAVRAAWEAKDEAGLEAALEKVEEAEHALLAKDETHVHYHAAGGDPSAFPSSPAAPGGMTVPAGAAGGQGDRTMSDADLEERFSGIEKSMNDGFEEIKAKLEGKEKEKAEDSEAQKEIEGNLEEEAPPGTGDKARRATDSVFLVDSYQETVAMAEILAPGIRVLSLDRAAPPKQTLDSICRLRRSALDLAYLQPAGRGVIDQLQGGRPLQMEKMSCKDVRTLFRAAAGMMRDRNNVQHRGGDRLDVRTASDAPKRVTTAADLNALHKKKYGG